MVDVKPELETTRARPALPLTVPTLLALAAWGFALCHWRVGPPPSPGLPRAVNDPVAGELRQFRTLTEPGERVRAIARLGPIRDPRVTVALFEAVQAELEKERTGASDTQGVLLAASFALFECHIPEAERLYDVKYWTGDLMWWDTHEVEVRRQAASLPR